MKIFLFIVGGIVILIVGYLVGSFFPITGFMAQKDSISGNTELKVTVLTESGAPVKELEVDVATAPGMPPPEGVAYTDINGIASYKLKPGKYFVFFNGNNFPQDLQSDLKQIRVESNKHNELTFTLKKR